MKRVSRVFYENKKNLGDYLIITEIIYNHIMVIMKITKLEPSSTLLLIITLINRSS